MVDENIQRKNYSPIEMARAFILLKEQKITQEEIAKKYGVDQSRIAQIKQLERLPSEIQNKLNWDEPKIVNQVNKPITPKHAYYLSQLDSPQKQIEVAKLIKKFL
ncbi:MAG: helix-turn-helix domain-containing protein [archaeon]|nr:helix-turn-helix domain-containing protein [archaeon]